MLKSFTCRNSYWVFARNQRMGVAFSTPNEYCCLAFGSRFNRVSRNIGQAWLVNLQYGKNFSSNNKTIGQVGKYFLKIMKNMKIEIFDLWPWVQAVSVIVFMWFNELK